MSPLVMFCTPLHFAEKPCRIGAVVNYRQVVKPGTDAWLWRLASAFLDMTDLSYYRGLERSNGIYLKTFNRRG